MKETLASSQGEQSLPGHDIFWTPDNSHFHSKISYKTLNTSKQEIRLIRILPDSGCGLVECELLHNIPLADTQGHYFALSYCAGDACTTGIILVNGIRCNVFANLRHALVEARHFWKTNSRDGNFLLWVDQVCIDQYNLSERSHQVGFMRNIYQGARQTLICLSTSKTSTRGMRWLLKVCQSVPVREDDIAPDEPKSLRFTKPDVEEDENEEAEIAIERYHWHRLQEYLHGNIAYAQFVDGWIDFYDIVESPWWSRAWVFQEFIASDDVSFLHLRHSASWRDVSQVLDSFCRIHKHPLTNRNLFLELNPFEIDGPEDRQLCRIIRRVDCTHAQAALDTVEFMVRTKLNWSGSTELTQLLAHSRYCKASDDRDRVYAFIGLATPGYAIIPDYSSDNLISKVLTETTKSIILYEDSLDILSHSATPVIRQKKMTLPSWVADWTCKEISNIRSNHFGTALWVSLHGSEKEKANASFRNITCVQRHCETMALEVWGIFVDALAINPIDGFLSPEKMALFQSFETREYMVCCTTLAQCHDQLWILSGASVPIILRRQSQGYHLISCAAVFAKDKQKSLSVYSEIMGSVGTGRRKRERISIL